MKRRSLLFVIAFLVAAASTGAVFTYVSEVDARAVAGQQPTRVLVAIERIPAGTAASEAVAGELVEQKMVAGGSVPEGALDDVEEIADHIALGDIFPGEMLLAAKFAQQAPPNSGALTIPDGSIAISVTLEDPQRVAGFVTPGAEVAIFNTHAVLPEGTPAGQSASEDSNRATRLLLPRVQVLAVATEVAAPAPGTDGADEEAAEPSEATSTVALTLAVTQAEAEKVILSAETDSLWFALLSPSSVTAPSEGVDRTRLFD